MILSVIEAERSETTSAAMMWIAIYVVTIMDAKIVYMMDNTLQVTIQPSTTKHLINLLLFLIYF